MYVYYYIYHLIKYLFLIIYFNLIITFHGFISQKIDWIQKFVVVLLWLFGKGKRITNWKIVCQKSKEILNILIN